MIYLGVDPGTTRIGYGVIEEMGGRLRALAWGILDVPTPDASGDKRAVRTALAELLVRHAPDAAAVEKLFFLNNKRSAMAVSEMRGVIMLTLADHGLPVHEFSPPQVKQQVCGHGRAQKHQMQKMVGMVLGITQTITPDDAADALALALCCATVQKTYK
jgi:crossover junction endodeoxyribonuclease RuvC